MIKLPAFKLSRIELNQEAAQNISYITTSQE
jgi:hypothetical protein